MTNRRLPGRSEAGRHPGRSPRVSPSASPRTGSAESRDRPQNDAAARHAPLPENDPGSARHGRSGRDDDIPPSAVWSSALAAISLLAVDPLGLGGLVLRGPADAARESLLGAFRTLLPPSAPIRKLPLQIPDSRLIGGLDLAATLSAGRPVLARGLLAEADGGALVVAGAERMSPGLAGRLALALDAGRVAVERDGFAAIVPARFCVVACDEAEPDDAPPPASLVERLALTVSLAGVSRADLLATAPDAAAVAAARARLGSVAVSDEALAALAEAAERLGVSGLRPLIFARAAARAAAAFAGRDKVEAEDLALAARLVLGPRARSAPAPAKDREDKPDTPDEHEDDGASPGEDGADADAGELAEQVLEAALAALPPNLLSRERAERRRTPGGVSAGSKSGAAFWSLRRGRPVGARPGAPENGARLDLVETLRAAAPWQRMRKDATFQDPSPCKGEGRVGIARDDAPRPTTRAAPSSSLAPHPDRSPPDRLRRPPSPLQGEGSGRVLVRASDFRIKRLKARRRTVTIFVVDASGSAAMHRLAEAKGAVELLLCECYVRRDEAALIAFRGQGAELVLPPTRSLARAKRALAGLPGGGGTPLASGVEAAATLAAAVRRRGDTPTLVFLTDGQANVARDGAGGRPRAQEEATAAARALKALEVDAVVIDVSPRPSHKARELAETMAARYLPLPAADAAKIARAAAA